MKLTKLQFDNRAKLTAALRSGEYTQATDALAVVGPDGLSYCCLGVACVLGFGRPFDPRNGGVQDSILKGQLLEENDVLESLGFGDTDCRLRQTVLSELNDIGNSFEKIADRIDRDTARYGVED